MSLIFDTSVLIDIENREQRTLSRLQELSEVYPGVGQVAFMSLFEFIFGLKDKQPHNKERSLKFINKFECIPTTKLTAQILSDLKHKYDQEGKGLPLADLLIAAQTIENKGILITRDEGFERIEELSKVFV